MSSVFRTGQSTKSMAKIMKANQMSKVCAGSHEYPHVEKIKNLCEQNFKGTVAQPTVTAKELTSRQKEKPQGKKKNKEKPQGKKKNPREKEKPHGKKKKTHDKNNTLTAKEKRIKNVLSASKRFCRECFFFFL